MFSDKCSKFSNVVVNSLEAKIVFYARDSMLL